MVEENAQTLEYPMIYLHTHGVATDACTHADGSDQHRQLSEWCSSMFTNITRKMLLTFPWVLAATITGIPPLATYKITPKRIKASQIGSMEGEAHDGNGTAHCAILVSPFLPHEISRDWVVFIGTSLSKVIQRKNFNSDPSVLVFPSNSGKAGKHFTRTF